MSENFKYVWLDFCRRSVQTPRRVLFRCSAMHCARRFAPVQTFCLDVVLGMDHDRLAARERRKVDALVAAVKAEDDSFVTKAFFHIRSPTPISFIKSTVPCSSTPARMMASMSSRLCLSSTTDSMP
jgi:hypothetical protein